MILKINGDYAPQKVQKVDEEMDSLTTGELSQKIVELEAEVQGKRVLPTPAQGAQNGQ